MRKMTRFWLTSWMIIVLMSCAVWMPDIWGADRIALLLTCALLVCVYVLAECKVDRAHAPLVIREEREAKKEKPPEHN